MSMSKEPITKEGYDTLKEELSHLQGEERPAIIKAIAEARAHGDLKENHEYHSAREKQSFIEGRIMDLNAIIAAAEVIDIKNMTGETVKFGAKVRLLIECANNSDDKEEITYRLVGRHESDVTKGLLSIRAPLSKSLIGKGVNDDVEFETLKGIKYITILSVDFG